MKEIKAGIKESIQAFAQGSLSETSLALFKALGYNTKRQSPLDKKTYQGFQEDYLDGAARFNEDKALVRAPVHDADQKTREDFVLLFVIRVIFIGFIQRRRWRLGL